MKKKLFTLLIFSMSLLLMAQENDKLKEIGLTFYNLDNFGMTFKFGNVNGPWRINSFLINGNNSNFTQDSSSRKASRIRLDIRFGKEYRKSISENFLLRYGADLTFNYSYSSSESIISRIENSNSEDSQIKYEPGINIVLGINYIINKDLIFGAEYLPGISYSIIKTKYVRDNDNGVYESGHDTHGISYGLQSGAALLSLSYRF